MRGSQSLCRSRRSWSVTPSAGSSLSCCSTGASALPASRSIPLRRVACWPRRAPSSPGCRCSSHGGAGAASIRCRRRTSGQDSLTVSRRSSRRRHFSEHVVPTPGRIVFQDALGIGTKIRYDNPDRAPLLLIGGTDDRPCQSGWCAPTTRSPSEQASPTEFIEYPGRCHYQMAQDGWEKVADNIISWIGKVLPADEPAKAPKAPSGSRPERLK